MQISNHAKKRTKERLGLSKKIAELNAEKALKYGFGHKDAKAGLKRYITHLYFQYEKGSLYKVYHRNIYIFRDNVLITVIPVPHKFEQLSDNIEKMIAERRKQEEEKCMNEICVHIEFDNVENFSKFKEYLKENEIKYIQTEMNCDTYIDHTKALPLMDCAIVSFDAKSASTGFGKGMNTND